MSNGHVMEPSYINPTLVLTAHKTQESSRNKNRLS